MLGVDQIKDKMKRLEDGLEGVLLQLQELSLWKYNTERFNFGRDEVLMTRAEVIDSDYVALILSHDVLGENPEVTPHVELVFDNVQGIDNLVRQLKRLRNHLQTRAHQAKEKEKSRNE
jgi:hypothetical protein